MAIWEKHKVQSFRIGIDLKQIHSFNPLYYAGSQWNISELLEVYKIDEKAG